MRQFVTRNFAGYAVAFLAASLVLVGSTRPTQAQFRKIRAIMAPGVVPVPAGAAPGKGDKKAKEADEAADAMRDLAEKEYPGGAALKTDPEQQRLLKRAEQCVADGRLDLAAVLWQKVLDEAGDTLMTRDGRTYTSPRSGCASSDRNAMNLPSGEKRPMPSVNSSRKNSISLRDAGSPVSGIARITPPESQMRNFPSGETSLGMMPAPGV